VSRHAQVNLVSLSLLSALSLAGCARDAARTDAARTYALRLETDSSPADSGAAEPNLSVGADGRALLSWLAPAADSTTALRFSTREASGTWSEPREVIRRNDLFVNWADFPSVVTLADGRLLAHWLQRNGTGRYAYEVRMAESRDGGLSWGERVTPHTPGIPAEHGFAAIMPTADSGAGIVFLNGGAGAEDTHGAVMHLGYATWGAQGCITAKAVIDHKVCDCC